MRAGQCRAAAGAAIDENAADAAASRRQTTQNDVADDNARYRLQHVRVQRRYSAVVTHDNRTRLSCRRRAAGNPALRQPTHHRAELRPAPRVARSISYALRETRNTGSRARTHARTRTRSRDRACMHMHTHIRIRTHTHAEPGEI